MRVLQVFVCYRRNRYNSLKQWGGYCPWQTYKLMLGIFRPELVPILQLSKSVPRVEFDCYTGMKEAERGASRDLPTFLFLLPSLALFILCCLASLVA